MIEDDIARFARYKSDPWAFLTECTWTKDQADNGAVKPYPADLEYLKLVCKIWQRERFLAIPKSRRMMMSWTMIPLALWDCVFHKGKSWAFVSKKEEDSGELVERAEFVFNQIPPDKIPRSLLPRIEGGRMTKSPPKLIFNFGSKGDKTQVSSKIEGYPMGADQLRQFGFSGILGDECAFWSEGEKFYSSAMSTLESVRGTSGGGKMVLISSRAPGFFKKVVFDKLDSKSVTFPEVAPSEIKRPMKGVELWRNPKNKFLVVELHYTADPLKATPEFREAVKASLPLYQFLREYEKSWETYEGMPVFPNYQEKLHCADSLIMPHIGLPLIVGVDFGLTPALIVGQMQGNHLKIIREFTYQNESIKTALPKFLGSMRQLHPEHDLSKMYFFIDPAGYRRNQNDERTCALEMEECAPGINIAPGPETWEARRTAVEDFLLYIDKEGAGLEINMELCPSITSGFAGGYRYADAVNEIEPDKARPIKNLYSHPHDALQYLCHGARQNIQQTFINISSPSYGFMKKDKASRGKDYGRNV